MPKPVMCWALAASTPAPNTSIIWARRSTPTPPPGAGRMRFFIGEVHNFGGFFGGDTVSLSGAPWREPGAAEQTLTIDEAALANVASRHQIAAGMLLELTMAG